MKILSKRHPARQQSIFGDKDFSIEFWIPVSKKPAITFTEDIDTGIFVETGSYTIVFTGGPDANRD